MTRKQGFAALLACFLAFAALLGGCQSQGPLAAKVADREIPVTKLENSYYNSESYASYYGYSLDTPEGIEEFRSYLLENLIASNMKVYQAKLAGITLSQEELESAKETAKKSYDDTFQSFLDNAKEAGAADVNAYASKLFTDALLQNKTTVRKLKAQLLEEAENDLLVEKHKEAILADVSLDEDELLAKYEQELAMQKESFDADPAQYFTYESYSAYGYTAMPLYIPAGFFRVRQILVDDEETANDLKARIEAGEDFETLLAEYNTDPGMQGEDYAEGYLVGEGANYVTAFLDAALALKQEGDVSDIVKSDYGYHIIKRMKDVPAQEIPYASVRDTLDAYMQQANQADYYNSLVDGWLADETLVTRYPENYASVGIAK